jgi:TetR/AcrR family transcriptional regulator, mexJK operon transcriptional repressor
MTIANRGRVLRAATTSFLAGGYRTSVDDIARRAGLAKQTIYHHFPSKDALFREVANELSKKVLVELESGEHELRETLTRFAIAYRKRVLGAEGVATFRTLVPEVPRFPSRARAMYAASAGELTSRLADIFGEAMQQGKLRRDDPQLAAEMLLSMLGGLDRIKRLFGVPRRGEGEPQRAARIVDCFLRAYQK